MSSSIMMFYCKHRQLPIWGTWLHRNPDLHSAALGGHRPWTWGARVGAFPLAAAGSLYALNHKIHAEKSLGFLRWVNELLCWCLYRGANWSPFSDILPICFLEGSLTWMVLISLLRHFDSITIKNLTPNLIKTMVWVARQISLLNY